MSTPLQPHWDILPTAQKALWPSLQPARALGYVLYGGTAIALHVGHRTSVDFDLFTERTLDEDALRRALPFLDTATTLQQSPNTLTVATQTATTASDHVKVSFFGSIRFGRVGIPLDTADGVMQVASLNDLMATKLKVILQRVETRDYRDIAAMLQSGVDLATGLGAARQLFGNTFQPSESLKALTWFKGGDLDTLRTEERFLLTRAAAAVRELPAMPLKSTVLAESPKSDGSPR